LVQTPRTKPKKKINGATSDCHTWQGNPMAPAEQPRVGSFEISFVDVERGTSQLLFSKIQQGKWPARMDTILRRYL
jgi:hypothetical protein